MAKNKLQEAPKFFHATIATGLREGAKEQISDDGGQFKAGYIPGFAVITRGEALGHRMWIDAEFIAQVDAALSAAGEKGVKSRYTHPGMSADGLAKGLGRVVFCEGEDGISRGDLSVWASARKSPDGDLGAHVITRAQEDPESFGASISFMRDLAAEDEFFDANSEDFEYIDPWGDKETGRRFVSPDPENVNNYRHARLAELRAVDIVDDPAANPDGLFCKDPTFADAEELMAYALGLSDDTPELTTLGVDPDRISSYVDKFLSIRGLEIMPVTLGSKTRNKELAKKFAVETEVDDEVKTEDEPAAETDEDADADEETPEEEASETEDEPAAETDEDAGEETPEAEPTDNGRKDCGRYVEAFGATNGAKWFVEGVSFEDAAAKHAKVLTAENAKLKKQLALKDESEDTPLESGGGDEGRNRKGAGFASNLKVRSGKK